MFCEILMSLLFEYDTPKIVHIRSKKVGVINRLIQLVIISYIVGYVIVYKKGYQEFDQVVGSISTKVKGISLANYTVMDNKPGVWDVADYVVPPQENGAVFVMTNAIVTYNQSQTCPQDVSSGDFCTKDGDCPTGSKIPNGDGYRTGRCVNSTQNATKVCEIYAWCPFEIDTVPEPLLSSAVNFTLFIKNDIHFPLFNVSRRNIIGLGNDSQLKSCRYDPNSTTNRFCPIFVIGDIMKFVNGDPEAILKRGASIQVNIQWDCNLDHNLDQCVPVYQFRRLDKAGPDAVSEGFNFRYAKYFEQGDKRMRNLVKAFGIHFLVTIEGEAGKFSVVPLLLNVASGLALLSLASVMSDIIMLYILKSKNFYRQTKYENVDDSNFTMMANEDTSIKAYGTTR
ncbi:P2X purinoceptor 4-like [Argonauta hians]